MKKIFAFIFLILFVLLFTVFLILLNFRIQTASSDNIKSTAMKSGLYDTVAAYLKEEIVEEGKLDLSQGNTFERLNEEVNSASAKKVVDAAIDQTYQVFKDWQSPQLAVSYFNTSLDYRFNKTVQLDENIFAIAYHKIILLITIAGLGTIISLILMVLCLKDLRSKLNWVGMGFALTAIVVFLSHVGFAYFIKPNELEQFVKVMGIFGEIKLINGFSKFIAEIFSRQSLSYYVESGLFFIIACFLWFSSGALKKQVIDKIDTLFFKEEIK